MKQRRFGGAGGEGNRQPVYYQGSIEKHLGTNRTPPSVTPNHSAPVSPAHSAKPQGEVAQGGHGGRKQDGGCGGLKMEYPSTTPPWCFRCCILATALRVWPVVIWLHSVSQFMNIHRSQNRLSCTTISKIMPPTRLLQPGHSSYPTGRELNYHQQTEGSFSLHT